MGYTHYWQLKGIPTQSEWDEFVTKTKALVEKTGVKLGNGIGEDEPIFNDDKVCFNGWAANGEDYETFCIDRYAADLENEETKKSIESYEKMGYTYEKAIEYATSDFCKTQYRNYDVCVCIALLVAKAVFGEKFTFSSDGDMTCEGWQKAYEYCSKGDEVEVSTAWI